MRARLGDPGEVAWQEAEIEERSFVAEDAPLNGFALSSLARNLLPYAPMGLGE
jgi:hypothetical protein